MWIEKGGLIVGMGLAKTWKYIYQYLTELFQELGLRLGLMSYIQDWLELICMQKADLSIEEGLVLPVQVSSGR